jgi:hypothetical protein
MTIALPPDVWAQAAIALLAGVASFLLGFTVQRVAWHYHDKRAERYFCLGLIISIVGLSWTVLGLSIIAGANSSGEMQEAAVRDLVVFANAATRSAVLLLAAHAVWQTWRHRKEHVRE